MADAKATESIASLFELMPQEALEPNPNLPANEPLSLEQRQEAIDWLLAPDKGGVSLVLRKPYNNPEMKDLLVENLLLNSWFLPDQALGNRIPLQAGSGHKVGSSTIPLTLGEDSPKRVDIVIKPFRQKHVKAELELDKFEEVKKRGINTIEPFGVLDINDKLGHETYVMTILKKGVIPLQKINFEELNIDRRFSQLKDFLKALAQFIAQMHNKGITHQDLHLGNIAADITQENSSEFLVFDLERASVLRQDKLGNKKSTMQQPEELMRKFRFFEKLAINDIATVAAEIAARNEHIAYDVVIHNLVLNYLRERTPSHGRPTDEEFMIIFDQKFKKLSARVKKSIEWNRARLREPSGSSSFD